MVNNDTCSIWVIIPVHNRRKITLRCLEHLKETQDWERFEVLVVDDGSTDGTSEAIAADFPSVTVLEGDGSLWWGGAIKAGMKYAKNENAEIFIWLNDDVLPEPGGVTKLAQKVDELGDTVLTTRVTPRSGHEYSTCNKKTRLGLKNIPYDSDTGIQYCDAAAGKFTAFPREIVDTIGLPDTERFPHNYCDHEYTLRAKESGFKIGVYSDLSARDTQYQSKSRDLSSDVSLEEVIKNSFCPSRHVGYNLLTRYHQSMRFHRPPSLLSYFAFIFYTFETFGTIAAKFFLTLLKENQDFRKS